MALRRVAIAMLTAALVAAACSGSGDGDLGADVVTNADSTTSTTDAVDTTGPLDETLALDDGDGTPTADNQVPGRGPTDPVGRTGFTRYVYIESNGRVIPSLVEGPRRSPVRCQTEALPCSFADLAALAASGDPIPAALGMTADELDDLVDQLSDVQGFLEKYADVNNVCADGYAPDKTQTPNMGSHFTNMGKVLDGEFVAGEPEIILYARVDEAAPDGPLGTCRDGAFEGDDVEVVGVAYYLPFAFFGDDHPEGFAGPIDNWHVHYNLCRLAGADLTLPPNECAGRGGEVGESDDASLEPGRPQGDAGQGWMIHAWADPEHDNQLGAFSMWNPTIWPVTDVATVTERGSSSAGSGANVIDDFTLPDLTVRAGDRVRFFNADDVSHTVTAGTAEAPAGGIFDTGIFSTRSVEAITVDEPGTYAYFCELHPTMQGTITVEK